MVRLNKEYKLNVCDGIKVKYGTVNKINPSVIYIKCRMWVKPIFDDDYKLITNNAYINLKKHIRKAIVDRDLFSSRHILSFDIKPDNFIYKKSTFCSLSLFLKQKSETPMEAKKLKNIISSDFGNVLKEFEDYFNNNGLLVRKEKW